MKKTKLCHVITCLDQGGAQTMLLKLLASEELQSHFESHVFSFLGEGVLGPKIRSMGIKVFSVNTGFNFDIVRSILALVKYLKRNSIEIVQTWTYHSDIMGGIAAKIAGIKNILWGVRHANLDWKVNSFSTVVCAYSSVFLSYFLPKIILYCSSLGKTVHENLGYNLIGRIIPNGFDSNRFSRSKTNRQKIRKDHSIPENAIVIGCVGRYHPIKGQKILLDAFKKLEKEFPDLWLVYCGRGVENELRPNLGASKKVVFISETKDVEKVYQLFDVFCLPSLGEAFPNVLAEAMLTENFCVACDVGDVSIILNNFGFICEPGSVSQLYSVLHAALVLPKSQLEEMASSGRKYIVERFSNQNIISQYLDLYSGVVDS